MTKFQIVTMNEEGRLIEQRFETDDPAAAFEIRGYSIRPEPAPQHLREELRDQPRFEGLLGPMWGGLHEGEPLIRYEDQRAYNALSE